MVAPVPREESGGRVEPAGPAGVMTQTLLLPFDLLLA